VLRHQPRPFRLAFALIVLIMIGAVAIGAGTRHTVEASLGTSTGQSLTLVTAGACVFVLLVGVLLWVTGRLREEWKWAQVQHRCAQSTETTMRHSEEQYRILYEDNPSMYFTLDPAGTVLSVNRFGAEQLGYTVEELIGKPVIAVFHEDDKHAVLRQLASLLERPWQVGRWQLRKVHKDGSVMWVEEDARAVCDSDGDLRILVVCQNITERKQAEKAVQFSEQRYRELVGSLDGIVWEADPADFRLLYMSPQVKRILGYTPEQWLTQDVTWKDVIHPEDFPMVMATCQREVEARRNHALEYRMRIADGRIIWIRDVVTVVLEQGRAVKLRGVLFDITDRKQAEEALECSEQTLRLVLQEREQFARDLHDRIIQSIYAIGLTLEECQRLIPGAREKASQKLGAVIVDLNRVIRDVRNYIATPSTESRNLTTDELIVSLQRLTDFMERSTGARFRLTINPEAAAALAQNQRPHLLSIAQEAMSNSLRHAHASTASVSLGLAGNRVCFEVSDDGVGFDPQVIRPESQGLQNIEMRAKKLGAAFQITSRLGYGTQIRLDIPRSERRGHECDSPFDGPDERPQART
jgi:PAS domain S-box-containing protein